MSDRRESSGIKGKKKEPSILQRLGVVDSPPSSPSVSSDHVTEISDQSETPIQNPTTSAPVFSYADALSSESSLNSSEAEATPNNRVVQQSATEDAVPPSQSKLRQSSITAEVARVEAENIMGPTADLLSGRTKSPSPTPKVEQARPQPIMLVSEGDIAPPALFRNKPQSQPEQELSKLPVAVAEEKEPEMATPQRPWGVPLVVEQESEAEVVKEPLFDSDADDFAAKPDQLEDNIASVPFSFGAKSEASVSTNDQVAEKQADSEIIPFTFGTDSSSDSEILSDAVSTPEMIKDERKDSITSAKSLNSQAFSTSVQSDKGLDLASTTAQYGSESIGEESLAERLMSDNQEEQRRASTTAQYGSESIGEESLAERKLSDDSTQDAIQSNIMKPESTATGESRKDSLLSTVSSIKTLAALDLEDEVAADEIEMRRRSSGILSGVSKVRRLSTSSIHSIHSISKQSIKEESPERPETITAIRTSAGDGVIRKDSLASSRRSSTASGRVAAAIAALESGPSDVNKRGGVIVERKRSIDSLESSSTSSTPSTPSTKSQTKQGSTVDVKKTPSSSSSNASVRGSDVCEDEALLEPCRSQTETTTSKTRKESIQETLATELGDVDQNEGKTVEQVLSVVTSVANRNSSVIEQTTVKDVQGKDVVVVVVVPAADAKVTPTSAVKDETKTQQEDVKKDETKKEGWMKKVAGWMHLNKDKSLDQDGEKEKGVIVENAEMGPTPKSSIAIVDTPTEGTETYGKSKEKTKTKSAQASKTKPAHDTVDPLNVNTYPKDGSLPSIEDSKKHHKASKKESKKTKQRVPVAVSAGSTPSFSGTDIDLESQTSHKSLKKKEEGFRYRSWYTLVLIIFFVTVSCIAFMYAMGILYR